MRARLIESVFQPKTLEGVDKELYGAMDELKGLGFNVYNFTNYDSINIPGLFAFTAESTAVYNYRLDFKYRTPIYVEWVKTTKQRHESDYKLGWQAGWNKAYQDVTPSPVEVMFELNWNDLLPQIMKSISEFEDNLEDKEHKVNNAIIKYEKYLKELKQELHHLESIKQYES